MPEEMLSFLAGGSTPGLIKPIAYDAIGVPKSEIRKIVHDAKATLPTSERMVQRSSTWLLDVAMARSVMSGELWRLCAEGGKRYTQALYLSAGFGDLNVDMQ
jgi:hypothetical protein